MPKTGHASLTELEKKKVEGIHIKKMNEDEGVRFQIEQFRNPLYHVKIQIFTASLVLHRSRLIKTCRALVRILTAWSAV